jgi:hypothetical protein
VISLQLTKRQVDTYVWRLFAASTPKADTVEETVSLLKKLKAISYDPDNGGAPDEDRVPRRYLSEAEAHLELERDEHKLLRGILERGVVKISNALQDEYDELRRALDAAGTLTKP